MYLGSGTVQYGFSFPLASGGSLPTAQDSTWTRPPPLCWDWRPFNQRLLTKMSLFFVLFFFMYTTNSGKNPKRVSDITIIPFPLMVFFTGIYQNLTQLWFLSSLFPACLNIQQTNSSVAQDHWQLRFHVLLHLQTRFIYSQSFFSYHSM